ncbi:cupin domain-containing protein [Microbacterium aoyamense]|uniref:Cupin domain-containing protein n=1 Tax=Microbacterium aoyamense TaxID=344166 RepID=A0ABN2PN82_9MICO|nr:cupin [Microbacterium aoyamense]
MTISSFPGGTAVSRLDVYPDASADGVCGGSPHMHLVSTEAYLVTHGAGAVQTIDTTGYRETPLGDESVVWFTPGTIHRAVDRDGLRAIVLMSNAGLPEAGDAVLTFPAAYLADTETYIAAAALPDGSERPAAAIRRRDLAVEGFLALRARVEAGDDLALPEFHGAAARIVAERAKAWPDAVRSGPLQRALDDLALAEAVARGDVSQLRDARIRIAEASPGDRGWGMCGRLRTYDLKDRELDEIAEPREES